MLCEKRMSTIQRAMHTAGRGPAAELGTYNGGIARFIADARPKWPTYVFDTFTGMPQLKGKDEEFFTPHMFASLSNTIPWLQQAQNIVVCQGLFPDSIPPDMPDHFAIVHLDGDLYESTLAGLQFFWPRLHGYMILDDFERMECPGVLRALNAYLPDWKDHVVEADPGNSQLVLHRP